MSAFEAVEIPYGAYWSTPFTKWQGSFQHLNSIAFAAWVCERELAKHAIDARSVDHGILGTTVIQHHSFYGLPWLTGAAGLRHVTGPTISQACATGVRLLLMGVQEVLSGLSKVSLLIAADRCSNGAHVYYPEPGRAGGTGTHEDWVLDSFACDPLGQHSMLQTGENVARKYLISTQQQHEVVLQRLAQYREALKDNRAFQHRYMTLPFEVPRRDFKRIETSIEGDEGIYESTLDGLAKLRPVIEGGTITFGGQTHPADGSCGLIVVHRDRAAEMSRDPSICVQICGFGQARSDLGFMPEATVPAAQAALAQATLKQTDLHAIKTHNPFVVNDIVLARALEFSIERMNNYGCSLIWGHPQAPTALRSIMELIEELVLRGGGYGLFTGCAAGDSSMAVVIKVSQRSS